MRKLSILTPVYNREKTIGDTIESVLAQDYQDWEMVISDNNSTDSTWDIICGYSSGDPRIKPIRNKENLGAVPNWKRCLEYATGKYVHWLWSDDWIEKGLYTKAFDRIGDSERGGVNFWNYRYEDQSKIKNLCWRYEHPEISGYYAARKILFFTMELPVSPAAYILPRRLVENSFFDTIPEYEGLQCVSKAVGVDSLMVANAVLQIDRLYVLREPLVNFRVHDNLTTQYLESGILMDHYHWAAIWYLMKRKVKISNKEISKLLSIYSDLKRKYPDLPEIDKIKEGLVGFLVQLLMKLSRWMKGNVYLSRKREILIYKLLKWMHPTDGHEPESQKAIVP